LAQLVEHFHGKYLGVPVRLPTKKPKSPVLAALSGTDDRFAERPFATELRRL
jgi:hypothetical protein